MRYVNQSRNDGRINQETMDESLAPSKQTGENTSTQSERQTDRNKTQNQNQSAGQQYTTISLGRTMLTNHCVDMCVRKQ